MHLDEAQVPQEGTVIQATLRTQDLIPAFLEAVSLYDPMAYAQLILMPFGPVPSYVYDDGDDSEWWDGEDAIWLLEQLQDTLNDAGYEHGLYFGVHPGDGSDFGFWSIAMLEI